MKFLRLKILFVVLALGLIAAGLAYQLRPDVPPVKGVKRIADLPGSAPHYIWLDPDTILLVRNLQQPSLFRHTISTGTDTPVPVLENLFRKSKGRPDSLSLSSDGVYLLWTSEDRLRTSVVRLDGTNYSEVTHKVPSLAYWWADGKRWAALEVYDDRLGMATTYLREKPVSVGTVPLSQTLFTSPEQTNLAQAIITDQGKLMVQTRAGLETPMERASILLVAFSPNMAFTQTMTFPAPHDNIGGDVFFAGRSHLLGWTLRFQQPWPYLQSEMGIGSKTPKTYSTGFWVMSQLTRQKTMLGYLETTRDDTNSGPYNVQFSPDGSNISYVYNNAVYLLPVQFH